MQQMQHILATAVQYLKSYMHASSQRHCMLDGVYSPAAQTINWICIVMIIFTQTNRKVSLFAVEEALLT